MRISVHASTRNKKHTQPTVRITKPDMGVMQAAVTSTAHDVSALVPISSFFLHVPLGLIPSHVVVPLGPMQMHVLLGPLTRFDLFCPLPTCVQLGTDFGNNH
jgi:hypothetical protein